MWHFRTWFNRNGGVGLMVGLDDLRGLLQPMILRFTQEASPCSLSSSAPTHPSALLAWRPPSSLGSPRALCLSGAQLLSDLTKKQQICYACFIFLLALELAWQEKGRSEGRAHVSSLITLEDSHKKSPHSLCSSPVTCRGSKMRSAGNFCLLSLEN